ncbi:MAG: hypothetical protein MJE12_11385 [Alphaproteobacteria bacterium]|nr:hypothetical protein [Alphaproteobacteria bacterium]
MTDAFAIGRFDAVPAFPASRPGAAPVSQPERQPPQASSERQSTPPTSAQTAQRAASSPLLDLRSQAAAQEAARGNETGKKAEAPPARRSAGPKLDPNELTEAERKKVEELKRRDREVRAHEQAHKTAGGSLAGNPRYQTVQGPDGRSYAVSGEVSIDTSEVPNNPEATIRKMEIVKRAALAPSQPSAQDRQVAAEADRKIQKARQEKREIEAEERAEAAKKRDQEPQSQAAGEFQPIAAGANPFVGSRPGANQPGPGQLNDLVA